MDTEQPTPVTRALAPPTNTRAFNAFYIDLLRAKNVMRSHAALLVKEGRTGTARILIEEAEHIEATLSQAWAEADNADQIKAA